MTEHDGQRNRRILDAIKGSFEKILASKAKVSVETMTQIEDEAAAAIARVLREEGVRLPLNTGLTAGEFRQRYPLSSIPATVPDYYEMWCRGWKARVMRTDGADPRSISVNFEAVGVEWRMPLPW